MLNYFSVQETKSIVKGEEGTGDMEGRRGSM